MTITGASCFARTRVIDIGVLDPRIPDLCSNPSADVTGSAFTIDDGQSL